MTTPGGSPPSPAAPTPAPGWPAPRPPGPPPPTPAAPAPSPAPTPAPAQPRNHQARLALITALVALVSAIAGPLVSLKINSDQITTQRALAGDQSQSDQANFLRNERRTTYAAYGAAFSKAYLGMLASSDRLHVSTLSEAELKTETDRVTGMLSEVLDAYYGVSLIGTTAAVETSQKLLNATTAMYAAYGDLVTAYQRDPKSTDLPFKALIDAGDTAGAVSGQFIQAARTDIEANKAVPTPEPTK